MPHPWRTAAVVMAVALVGASCSSGADVTATELTAVVERDGVVIDGAIPAAVLDRLAANRVVLLGETHHLREHWAFVAQVLGDLHARGFRRLLVESPHMVGWFLDDYVQGGVFAPDKLPPPFYLRKLEAIRAFNVTLPAADRIHVYGIDANEDFYGGAGDFQILLGWVADHLPEPGPLAGFSGSGYASASADDQTAIIQALQAALEAGRPGLVESWGDDWYEQVVEMAGVELASIPIRVERARDDNAAARAREQLIKQLVDERIGECDCGVVINMGAHHAQKSHLMGTKQEWVGDYLAHTSTVVGGSIVVIGLTSARTELEPGAGGTPFDILESASPDNEVLRVMAQTRPGATVFLPLDDPLFTERTVAYNSEDVIYTTPLHDQFDALIQYGLAHRMPEG